MEGSSNTLQQFKNLVGIRFQLYNSLFTSLPFHKIEKTGILLSLFLIQCEEGFAKHESPETIIERFLQQNKGYETAQQQLDLLFRFIQYAERQVVLFDALEDAAFTEINDVNGIGSLKHLSSEIQQTQRLPQLSEKLKDFAVRLVLTAHPTQFYPGEVLAIIHDLSKALQEDDAALVNMYLQQLGKTPFLKKQKPTPYDEAVSLLWFLEHIFYPASGNILSTINSLQQQAAPVIRLGFWPGGDRDGNPFVKADTTLKVAGALRLRVLKCYYQDVRQLRRRLTFQGVEAQVIALDKQIYDALFNGAAITQKQIEDALQQIRAVLVSEHNGLFLDLVDNMTGKVAVFGLYFATLDIRQDSTIHTNLMAALAGANGPLPENYTTLTDQEKIKIIERLKAAPDLQLPEDEVLGDCLEAVKAMKTIQERNGEAGCNRYIISHCTSALNMMEVYALFLLAGWEQQALAADIVPLFETVDDLQHAEAVMQSMYENGTYKQHLALRGNVQTIMLGFSDGTKDGGYLMANWAIYKAKEALTRLSRQHGIEVIFFDGRGGPPARGGGKTHRFYASMGRNISNKEIQLTIQGQTISSNFGTIDSAQYNIEQLLHAGIANSVLSERAVMLTEQEEALLTELSQDSFTSYTALKNHPLFLDYLSNASPLRFYADTNIGSRPAKRGGAKKMTLNDLRAIPFVGSWSQIKQNVPGYYGVGTALQHIEAAGRWQEVQELYQQSLFFRTLIDNCEMAMMKSCFPLTAYLSEHPKYGEVWNMIYNEYELTRQMVLQLSGNSELMEATPVGQLSVQMRERIVLPLTTIQQYGIMKIRRMEENNEDDALKPMYEKLVMRCSFGIINAGRNSA